MRHVPRFRRLLAAALALAALAGCVSPLVNHTPYQNPYFAKDDFERLLASWKAGRAVTWEAHYRESAFASEELVLNSEGPCSLGPKLPTAGKQARTFTPTKAELAAVVDTMTGKNLFALYDGIYAPWMQASGPGGQELRVLVGGMEKHVSRDPNLSPGLSWEAATIQAVSDAMVQLGLKYLK
jgi:hypothetical protein